MITVPLGWKLVPVEPTRQMLDAMNECGIEGYDEIMGDGFSASLYYAAIDAAPPQHQPNIECQRCGRYIADV
jgi:hypothetical protein